MSVFMTNEEEGHEPVHSTAPEVMVESHRFVADGGNRHPAGGTFSKPSAIDPFGHNRHSGSRFWCMGSQS
jgi:hypothetical protein